MRILFEYRFFHRFQEFFQLVPLNFWFLIDIQIALKGNAQFVELVPLNFDSKHGPDPFKSTPRIKFSGKNSSLNGPIKICVSHDLRKKYSFFTLIYVFKSLIYILFQMVWLLSKVLLKIYSIKPRKPY